MHTYVCARFYRSCSKCKWRKGRSAFRQATRQSRHRIQTLYDIYERSDGVSRRLAGEKLQRWGFNPNRRCLLTLDRQHLLITRSGHEDELFPGLDFRDRLHGLHVFIFRVLNVSLCGMGLSAKLKQVLDQRMMEVGIQRVFRTSGTERSYRVQRSLFTDANMSGADKTHWVFLLPHVIGHRASCLPESVREPFLCALARAQLMFLASRGLRPYNEAELHEIYDEGYLIFFGAMERVHQLNHDRVHTKKLRKHRRNPTKYPAPKRFKCQNT